MQTILSLIYINALEVNMPIIKLVTLVLGCYQICSDDKIADINKRILQLGTTALNIDLMSLFEFTPVIVLSLSSVALSAFDLLSWIIYY